MSSPEDLFRCQADRLIYKSSIKSQTQFQEKLFAKGPVYKQSTADIEEKIREINKAVEAVEQIMMG